MKFVEFLVFLARASHEVYKDTPQADIGLHLKIDNVMRKILEVSGLQQMFSCKEEEEEESEGNEPEGMATESD